MIFRTSDLDLFQRWRAIPEGEHGHVDDAMLIGWLSDDREGEKSHHYYMNVAFREAVNGRRFDRNLGYPMDTITGKLGNKAGHEYCFQFTKREWDLDQLATPRISFTLPLGEHFVSGHIEGRIDEHAGLITHVTTDPIDMTRCMDSWQWRTAVVALRLRAIRHEVWRAKWTGGANVQIIDMMTLTQYPSPGMADDMLDAVGGYAQAAERLGWTGRDPLLAKDLPDSVNTVMGPRITARSGNLLTFPGKSLDS